MNLIVAFRKLIYETLLQIDYNKDNSLVKKEMQLTPETFILSYYFPLLSEFPYQT
jgi:hypothetical protein